MGNIIRAEVSENNPYWIEKHRYYELNIFAFNIQHGKETMYH